MKLSELLYDLEFNYVINDDDTLSLIDMLGANLGNIEEEKLTVDKDLALFLVDRLDKYIYDYKISGIVEILEKHGYSENDIYPYDTNLIELMKKFKDEFDNDYIEHIYNIVSGNLDITDILEDIKVKARCPRCGKRLRKSNVKGYTYQCIECDEDFYSFEVFEV